MPVGNYLTENKGIRSQKLSCYRLDFTKISAFQYGRSFIKETDHKPLVHLQNAKVANSRLMRWSLYLQSYNFTTEVIKGSDNLGADFLSRHVAEQSNFLFQVFLVAMYVFFLLFQCIQITKSYFFLRKGGIVKILNVFLQTCFHILNTRLFASMVTELYYSALRHRVGNLFFQLLIYSTTCSVTYDWGLTRFRRLSQDTKLCGRCQCLFYVIKAVSLLCCIQVTVWSMCLFLVM